MKTSLLLVLPCLLAACSPIDEPPARLALGITFAPDRTTTDGACNLNVNTTIPQEEPAAGLIHESMSDAELKELKLVKDGADGAMIDCKVKESGGGYELSVDLEAEGSYFGLTGTAAGFVPASEGTPAKVGTGTGSVDYNSQRLTAGTFGSTSCNIWLSHAKKGEAVIRYSCNNFKDQYRPETVCNAAGAIYVKDCN